MPRRPPRSDNDAGFRTYLVQQVQQAAAGDQLDRLVLPKRELIPEGDGTFEADPETEKMLLDAIAECERGETWR